MLGGQVRQALERDTGALRHPMKIPDMEIQLPQFDLDVLDLYELPEIDEGLEGKVRSCAGPHKGAARLAAPACATQGESMLQMKIQRIVEKRPRYRRHWYTLWLVNHEEVVEEEHTMRVFERRNPMVSVTGAHLFDLLQPKQEEALQHAENAVREAITGTLFKTLQVYSIKMQRHIDIIAEGQRHNEQAVGQTMHRATLIEERIRKLRQTADLLVKKAREVRSASNEKQQAAEAELAPVSVRQCVGVVSEAEVNFAAQMDTEEGADQSGKGTKRKGAAVEREGKRSRLL